MDTLLMLLGFLGLKPQKKAPVKPKAGIYHAQMLRQPRGGAGPHKLAPRWESKWPAKKNAVPAKNSIQKLYQKSQQKAYQKAFSKAYNKNQFKTMDKTYDKTGSKHI